MAITSAPLQGGVLLTTTTAAIYTCPPATKAVVKRAVFANYTALAVTITVTITRAGGSALNIITVQPIAANSAYTAPELAGMALNPGDVVNALASTLNSVNAFVSGFTVV